MSVLVTGGAGFMGSVLSDQLRARGEQVAGIDDLSRGYREVVNDGVPFYQATVGDTRAIARIVEEQDVDACIHLAGLIAVGESVAEPALYWRRNVAESIDLLETLSNLGVENVVFSSSAGAYGDPIEAPCPRDIRRPQRALVATPRWSWRWPSKTCRPPGAFVPSRCDTPTQPAPPTDAGSATTRRPT